MFRNIKIATIIIIALATMIGCKSHMPAWNSFDETALQKSIDNGQPTLIQVTAEWCANGIYIEDTVLNSPEAMALYSDLDMQLLKADLTHENSAIEKWLANNDIPENLPVYIYYAPGQKESPLVLRNGLTKQKLESFRR